MSVRFLKTGNGSFSPLRSHARAASLKQPSLTFKPARWQNYLGASSRCRNQLRFSRCFPSTSHSVSIHVLCSFFSHLQTFFHFLVQQESVWNSHDVRWECGYVTSSHLGLCFLSFSLKNDKNAGCCFVVAVVINIFFKILFSVQSPTLTMSLVGNGSGEMSSSYWLGRCTVDILGLEKTRKKKKIRSRMGLRFRIHVKRCETPRWCLVALFIIMSLHIMNKHPLKDQFSRPFECLKMKPIKPESASW